MSANRMEGVESLACSRPLQIGIIAMVIGLSISAMIYPAIAVMVSPTFGVKLAGVVIGIAFLLYGIRLVVIGISTGICSDIRILRHYGSVE